MKFRLPPSAAKVDSIPLGLIENKATDEGLRVRRVTLVLATNVRRSQNRAQRLED